METIINGVANIVLDTSYENFTDSIYRYNYKTIEQNININSIYDEVLIITDQEVYSKQLDKFVDSIKAKFIYEYIIPVGEDSKSLDVYEQIMKYAIKINLSRKSLIIALGGGVVGDLAGYIASTYMRGIDIVQVPTSLLAQVDSSIGGKTGINISNYKNIIGTFYQPKLTYINVDSLSTLPHEEFVGGMAEVIKYGVIYDYEFLEYIIENIEKIMNKDREVLFYIVKRCAQIKAKIVLEDEKEGGLRKILNFGHTFGHGVEKLLNINHGNAVSIGMHMAFKLALNEGMIDKIYYDKFVQLLDKCELPLEIYSEDKIDEAEIFNIMKNDKKNSFSKINLILPTKEGKVCVVDNIEEEKILNVIKELNNA